MTTGVATTGPRPSLAAALKVDYATVKRWTADAGRVPEYVAALIEDRAAEAAGKAG